MDQDTRYYVRTCQECGKQDKYKEPPKEGRNDKQYYKWAATICKKCKSPGLNYGSFKSDLIASDQERN